MVLPPGKDGCPEMREFERFGWRGFRKCQHCLALCLTSAISIFDKELENSPPLPPAEMGGYMEQLVAGRRSCRRYLDRNVGPQVIDRILNAMQSALTGGNPSSVEYT